MGNLGCQVDGCQVEENLSNCKLPAGRQIVRSCTANSHQEELANTQLLRACELGDIDGMIEALAAGADIETRQIPLMSPTSSLKEHDDCDLPCALGSQEVVEFKDGGIYSVQDSPMECARKRKKKAVSEDRMPGLTPLMQAAKGGRAMAVALLLDADANPHYMNEVGMQPLHFAASVGCRESCQYLIGARACPSTMDEACRNVFACLPPAASRQLPNAVNGQYS
jgi:hypothetical protein